MIARAAVLGVGVKRWHGVRLAKNADLPTSGWRKRTRCCDIRRNRVLQAPPLALSTNHMPALVTGLSGATRGRPAVSKLHFDAGESDHTQRHRNTHDDQIPLWVTYVGRTSTLGSSEG